MSFIKGKCHFCGRALTADNSERIVICPVCGNKNPVSWLGVPVNLSAQPVPRTEQKPLMTNLKQVSPEVQPDILNVNQQQSSAVSSPQILPNTAQPEPVSVSKQDGSDFRIHLGKLVGYNGNTETVRIPAEVTSIEQEVFRNHTEIQFVEMPDSVQMIGAAAFYGCSKLSKIKFSDHLTMIGKQAFQDCISLESISIPDSVTEIAPAAFWGCIALKDVKFSNNLTEISNGLFSRCESLQYVVIPDSVTVIRQGAFSFTGLKYIRIPSAVTDVEKRAFWYCSSLEKIRLEGIPHLSRDAFQETPYGKQNSLIGRLKASLGI